MPKLFCWHRVRIRISHPDIWECTVYSTHRCHTWNEKNPWRASLPRIYYAEILYPKNNGSDGAGWLMERLLHFNFEEIAENVYFHILKTTVRFCETSAKILKSTVKKQQLWPCLKIFSNNSFHFRKEISNFSDGCL